MERAPAAESEAGGREATGMTRREERDDRPRGDKALKLFCQDQRSDAFFSFFPSSLKTRP
jgi:hypothetical protein